MELLLYLSSGLFLGWSLGANDAANVFGTAVGTRMIRFRTAALICSIFVVIGATVSGAGAAQTLGSLGAVNAIAGSFTVALSAALTVLWMTRRNLPVSTSQAIVGAIIGWNLYSESVTNTQSLGKIVGTWIVCPILSAIIAMILYVMMREFVLRSKLHLLHLDNLTRIGLIVVGAFGSYSLGANNIANVMGVFVTANPFSDHVIAGVAVSGSQQLFFLGALAIGVGVFTYSERVMKTVGGGLLKLTPLAALVVVLAQSIVLFLFASEGLETFLASHGLPTIPLVPVSSSQAVVGAVLGIGLLKRGMGIRYKVMGEISLGWVSSPILAGVMSFLLLFFVDNVFQKQVSRQVHFRCGPEVIEELRSQGIEDEGLLEIESKTFRNPVRMRETVMRVTPSLTDSEVKKVIQLSQLGQYRVSESGIQRLLDDRWINEQQRVVLLLLKDTQYEYGWMLINDLSEGSETWRLRKDAIENRKWNKILQEKYKMLLITFDVSADRKR
ncbi:MAG: anion permease [bacterium]